MWNEDDHPRKADGEFVHATAGAWARDAAADLRAQMTRRIEAAPAARQRRTPQGTPIGQWMAQVNDQMELR